MLRRWPSRSPHPSATTSASRATIVDAAHAQALARPLSFDLTVSPAGSVILEAAKKARLPWLRSYDSGLVMFRGTERLGPVEPDSGLPRVPSLGDLSPVRSAVAKLAALLDGTGPLRFETLPAV